MDLQLLLTGLEKYPLNNSIREIAGNLGLTIRRMKSGLPAFSSGFLKQNPASGSKRGIRFRPEFILIKNQEIVNNCRFYVKNKIKSP
jgi:hypothetical protein